MPRLNRLIARLGIPWYNVPGNHELNFEAADDRYSLETFKRYYGPPYYAFEYGDALFVVLDNIEYQGNGNADPGDVRGSGGYIANFGKRQLTWLRAESDAYWVDPQGADAVARVAALIKQAGAAAT